MKLIEKKEVEKLVPHKGKMFLLDRIIDYDVSQRTLCAEVDVKDSLLFVSGGTMPSWVVFEFMAQSVAALSGIMKPNQKVNLGFILSVSNFLVFEDFVYSGSTLQVYVKEDVALNLTYTYSSEVFLQNKKIAEGVLTVIEMNLEDAKKL